MAMDKHTSSQLKSMMTDPRFDLLVLLVAERIRKLEQEPITGQNEFETLRSLHTIRGKITGLKEFFDDLERGAYEN